VIESLAAPAVESISATIESLLASIESVEVVASPFLQATKEIAAIAATNNEPSR